MSELPAEIRLGCGSDPEGGDGDGDAEDPPPPSPEPPPYLPRPPPSLSMWFRWVPPLVDHLRSALIPPRCPICDESLPRLPFLLPRRCCGASSSSLARPCCSNMVCPSCVRSHICSILDEGAAGGGAGRTRLTCPMGCGSDLADWEVRRSLGGGDNRSPLRAAVGPCLFRLLLGVGLLEEGRRSGPVGAKSDRRHRAWMRLTKSAGEREALGRYERWSLAVGLASLAAAGGGGGDGDERVVRCPSPDCDCAWMASASHRRRKVENESRYDRPAASGRGGGRVGGGVVAPGLPYDLLRAASAWLFYRPLRPEDDDSDVRGGWVDAVAVGSVSVADPREPSSPRGGGRGEAARASRRDRLDSGAGRARYDSRRAVCPRCKRAFCGLCSRPWNTLSGGGGGGGGGRISHTGRLCSSYARRAVDAADDDYLLAADAVDARTCPGCSMRTQRIEGCNHMTCSCGTEWCYVCEVRWGVRHYGCVDRTGEEEGGDGAGEGGWCAVS